MLPGRLGSELAKFDCRQNNIQEVTFQQVAGMRQLKHLLLENNTIRNFEAHALRNCVQLSNLALEQNLLSAVPHGYWKQTDWYFIISSSVRNKGFPRH